ncbi:TD and POZ domain-containing protein 2 [Orchesella cincta]|uniref:TD and POZ domain-containing protein 2 n=1 Tax=Orchesella cincta TaxID=48709 RepID=A0A1D2M6Z8_ORCCI|nr:TD and POZ domain-containing protein 2 [Orchesella cincta]
METSTTTVKIEPISVARGKMKMSVIPDTAVPIHRTVRNMLQHNEYKYVWSLELDGAIGNLKPSILRSPIFELIPNKISPLFKDNQWYFEFGLNPCDDDVSLFLCSKGVDFSCNKANHFNLCFEVGLYNEQGNEFIVAKASGVEQINGDTNGLGWKNLCSYKCIKNAPSLHLRATIWTLGELKEEGSDLLPKKEFSLTPDSLRHSIVNDIASLWHEKRSEWTDMVIHVGYKSFPVHRAILAARSRFFHELFKKHRDEDPCSENSIRLDGVDLECMERILEYIYTGHIGTSETQKLTDLLELADKLQVSSCKTECFHRLSERLTLQNALSLAVMSYKSNVCTELKNRVKKFCLLHKDDLIRSKSFERLMEKSPFQLMCVFGSECFSENCQNARSSNVETKGLR